MDKKTEALKLALEAAEGIVNADWRKWHELASPDEFERWVKSRANHTATAIREALTEQPAHQEPVSEGRALKLAMAEENDKRLEAQQQEPDDSSFRRRVRVHLANRNFYSHSEFCEKLEALLHESPPASKPWVGLTEGEILSAPDDLIALIAYIEDKLREKNA